MKIIVKKLIGAGTLLAFSLTLAACSQQNPLQKELKTNGTKATAKFLLMAAKYGEHELKLSQDIGSGFVYSNCMKGKTTGEKCTKLYSEMVIFAHKNPEYRSLSVSDITDKKLWQSISQDYDDLRFTTL